MVMTHKIKGKFQSKWEGMFVIEAVYSNGGLSPSNSKRRHTHDAG